MVSWTTMTLILSLLPLAIASSVSMEAASMAQLVGNIFKYGLLLIDFLF